MNHRPEALWWVLSQPTPRRIGVGRHARLAEDVDDEAGAVQDRIADRRKIFGANPEFVIERFGRIGDSDRSFDVAYWQCQGDAAIFRAAWELVETYARVRGMSPDELRLQ